MDMIMGSTQPNNFLHVSHRICVAILRYNEIRPLNVERRIMPLFTMPFSES